MAHPITHFEIRAADADAARTFYGELFGWTYGPAAEPGYTYIDTGVEGGTPGGIGVARGPGLVTFFVGVENVAEALATAERLGGTTVLPATTVPGVTYALFADPEGHIIGVSSNP